MKKTPFSWLPLALSVFLLMKPAAPVRGQEYAPLYGIHTDPGMIYAYESMTAFVDTCAAHGYSAIMYMVLSAKPFSMGGDGGMDICFRSPTLEAMGVNFVEDQLAELVSASQARGLEVYPDIQALAYIGHNPDDYPLLTVPTADDLTAVINELADYGVTGVSEEMYLSEWYAPVYQACQGRGINYIHKAISWDFGAMSHYWNMSVFDVYSDCDIIMTEDYDMTLEPPFMPAYEHFAAISAWLGKEYHVKVWIGEGPTSRSQTNNANVMLLKALQLRPRYIYVMTWSPQFIATFDPAAMNDLIQTYASNEIKPVCNVVLHFNYSEAPDTWGGWDLPAALAAVTTGIKASGYDIITSPEPVADADMYFIYTRGRWETTFDLPPGIVELFDSGKPVFIQLSQLLPNDTPNWNTVREKLGIDNTTFEIIGNDATIINGNYNGVEYEHLRGSVGDLVPRLNDLTTDNVSSSAEVVSTASVDGATIALIVRNGNNYFINGSDLDLRAGFPVSNLINDGLQGPSACVISTGETSVFYVLDVSEGQLDTTRLHIKLPESRVNEVIWYKRDIDGYSSSGTRSYDHAVGYVDTLVEGTLLVLKYSSLGVNPRDDLAGNLLPSVHLFQNFPNPFNSLTTIRYRVGDGDHVALVIFDLNGRVVRTLVDKRRSAGDHAVIWDGKNDDGEDLGSGIYFCRLRSGRDTRNIKLLLIK